MKVLFMSGYTDQAVVLEGGMLAASAPSCRSHLLRRLYRAKCGSSWEGDGVTSRSAGELGVAMAAPRTPCT